MKITDEMVERALQAEHDQVGRHYVDAPFWYSTLDPSERIRAHDGMRAALEELAPTFAAIGWDAAQDAIVEWENNHLPEEYPDNPYVSKHEWKGN